MELLCHVITCLTEQCSSGSLFSDRHRGLSDVLWGPDKERTKGCRLSSVISFALDMGQGVLMGL